MRHQTADEKREEALDWAKFANLASEMQEWYWLDHYVDHPDGSFKPFEGSIYVEVDELLNKVVEAARQVAGVMLSHSLITEAAEMAEAVEDV